MTLGLTGELDETGMLADFHLVKMALTRTIEPLRRRTLMPRQLVDGHSRFEDGQVFIECGAKHYSLPAEDVVLLPIDNTTTEALAAHLLDQILPCIREEPGVARVELTLAEAPDTAATLGIDLGALS